MRFALLAANGLAVSFIFWPRLPSAGAWFLLLSICCALAFCVRAVRPVFGALALVLAALCWHSQRLPQSLLPDACDGQRVVLVAEVSEAPEVDESQGLSVLRFDARVVSLVEHAGACDGLLGKSLRLAWWSQQLPAMDAGEKWQLAVQLRRPRGQRNWHSPDYQLYLMREGFYATGRVRAGERLLSAGPSLQDWRHRWAQRLTRVADATQGDAMAAARALGVGDRSGLGEAARARLLETGTAHLLAISGLHVGLAAALGYWLSRLILAMALLTAHRRLTALWQQQWVSQWAAVAAAAGYCWFGGGAISTQRALLMVCCYFLLTRIRRVWSGIDAGLAVMLGLLLFNPLQASSPAFWLSFCAMFCLVLFACAPGNLWQRCQQFVRLQGLLLVVMAPVSITVFGGFSLVGLVANLVAVPWVSVGIVPLVLLSIVLEPLWPWLADGLIFAVLWQLEQLFSFLHWLVNGAADLGVPVWVWSLVTLPVLIVAAVSLLGWALPLSASARVAWQGVLLFALWVVAGEEQWRVHNRERLVVFDVGQGLALLVESGGQRLLYDTGPPFGQHTSAMARIVLPYLRAEGIGRLDYVVVSHGDADHAGGVAALVGSEVQVGQWLFGEVPAAGLVPALEGQPVSGCAGVNLALGAGGLVRRLSTGATHTGNDSSCVLEVRLPWLYLLLTGDISRSRELALRPVLSGYWPRLLVAAHHGSDSSSGYALLSAFASSPLVVSAGYGNRYGHPHARVLARAAELAMPVYNTAWMGALEVQPGPEGRLHWQSVTLSAARFWYW